MCFQRLKNKITEQLTDKMLDLPDNIILIIFSFFPSFTFYTYCKDILHFDDDTTFNSVSQYYFHFLSETPKASQHLVSSYIFLDYFCCYKHLLILDNHKQFEVYLRENHWVQELCKTNPKNKTIHESLRNIMRLSYFVNCLRELARNQSKIVNDKGEQSNVGISFQCLIEDIHKETESQTQMLKDYIKTTK